MYCDRGKRIRALRSKRLGRIFMIFSSHSSYLKISISCFEILVLLNHLEIFKIVSIN